MFDDEAADRHTSEMPPADLDWYGEKAKRNLHAKSKYHRSARSQTLLLTVVVVGLVLAFCAGIGTTVVVSRVTSAARPYPTPLILFPGAYPSPTAVFGSEIGMSGYRELTTQQVGTIPPLTRVRISSAQFVAVGWVYTIVASDEKTVAEASDSQLTYAPDVTPGVTPSS